MKVEKNLLSDRVLAKYNYTATKKNIEDELEDIGLLELKLKRFSLPSLSKGIDLREEQLIHRTTSLESESINEKVDLEIEIATKKEAFEKAVCELLPIEQVVYKASFENGRTNWQIAEAENTYIEYIRKVQISLVVKLGLLLGLAVQENKKKV